MRAKRLRQLTLAALPILLLVNACGAPLPFFGPTPTPTLTATPTLTPTPLPSPTPSPTPTPLPAARITLADAAFFAGDWGRALSEYQRVLDQPPAADLRDAAQLGVGKAKLYGGDPVGAANAFNALLQAAPESPLAADADFLLGETYRALGQWPLAIAAYREYQRLRPTTLDSYIEERIGQAAAFNGDLTTAAEAYQAAIAAPRAEASEVLDLRERLAEVNLKAAKLDAALAQYDAIFQATDQDARKAHALLLAGQALYTAGRRAEANQKYLQAVQGYPSVGEVFPALVTLVNDGVAVDDLARGLVNEQAQNYAPALAAFDRVLTADPTNATALYHKGLTLSDLQRNAEALAAFRQLVANFPADPLWPKAYYQIALILDYPEDAHTFEALVAAAPKSPDAPDALFRAARLYERHDDFALAAQVWTRLASEYPGAAQAADAAMQAGLVLFRAGDLASAAQRFAMAAKLGDDPSQHARAVLWIGKVKEKQGQPSAAQTAWVQAAALDPGGYYSLRATQLLDGQAPFTPPAGYSFQFDVNKEKADAEAWLRATFPSARGVADLSQLGAGVWKEARFVRGAELWRLGRLREAHAEFDSLRRDLNGDPLALWPLALYWNALGAYDLSIRAARQVLDLAGVTNLTLGPAALQRLRYPAPFAELVTAASAQYHLPVFLMYAKMRLESFFWKYAFSSAQARGLNQIIPPTADDIARKLGLQNFQQDDLFRPVVSIPMGAYYLNYVGQATGGDAAAILAGYYAGPGNAAAWLKLSGGDPDLLVEVIRLPDAQGYVQTAYTYFEMYAQLYGAR